MRPETTSDLPDRPTIVHRADGTTVELPPGETLRIRDRLPEPPAPPEAPAEEVPR